MFRHSLQFWYVATGVNVRNICGLIKYASVIHSYLKQAAVNQHIGPRGDFKLHLRV
jgi:hypothetical protein